MEKLSSNLGSSSGNSSSGGDDEITPSIIEMDEQSEDRSISLVSFLFLKLTIVSINYLFKLFFSA